MILAKKLAFELQVKNVEISRLTGLHPSTISKIMNGRQYPYPVEAKKIAKALDYDGNIDELFAEVMR